MQRLVLAVIFVALAVAAVATTIGVVRRAWSIADSAPGTGRTQGDTMQKLAFFLLIALILYVSVLGGT